MNLEDILKPTGAGNDNMAGLRVFSYYALYHEIATFPVPPTRDVATTYAELKTVTADFVFNTGGRFWKFQSTLEKSNLDGEAQGERDGKSSKNIVTLQHPGISAQMLGWLEEHKNSDLVLLTEDLDGKLRIVGAPGLPAGITDFKTPGGMAVADPKHVQITIESIGHLAPYYEGTIPLTPAV